MRLMPALLAVVSHVNSILAPSLEGLAGPPTSINFLFQPSGMAVSDNTLPITTTRVTMAANWTADIEKLKSCVTHVGLPTYRCVL